MTTLAQIGSMLHAARMKAGLKKTQLAGLSKVHRNTVQQVEDGAANIELNTLIALCDSLGLSIILVPNEVAEQIAPEKGLRQSALSRALDDRLGRTVVRAGQRLKSTP